MGKPTIITKEQAEGSRMVEYHMKNSMLREALDKYGRHEPTCAAYLFRAKPCNCGWDQARRDLLSGVPSAEQKHG